MQNKISRIEGLETLTKLRNLELGGNKIRVRCPSLRCISHMLTVPGNRESRQIRIVGGVMAWKEQNRRDEGSCQSDDHLRSQY